MVEGQEHALDGLLAVQAADIEKQRLVERQAERAPGRAALAGPEAVQIDAGGDHRDGRPHAALHELVAHQRRGRDHRVGAPGKARAQRDRRALHHRP